MGSICSKQPAYPAEFTKQVDTLQKIRESMLEIVNQLEKMNSIGMPSSKTTKSGEKHRQRQNQQLNILDEFANICNESAALFAGNNYGQQIDRLSTAFKKMSKSSMDEREQIERNCIAPMRQWAGDGFETLMKELVKCQKMKDDLKRAEKAAASKPGDTQLKEKLEQAKKAYDSQRTYCTKEFAATEKHFSNQEQYVGKMVEFQYKYSTAAHVTFDGALMKGLTVTSVMK